jgi:hypothetical protein
MPTAHSFRLSVADRDDPRATRYRFLESRQACRTSSGGSLAGRTRAPQGRFLEVEIRLIERLLASPPTALTKLERFVRVAALCGYAYRSTARPIQALVWLGLAVIARFCGIYDPLLRGIGM